MYTVLAPEIALADRSLARSGGVVARLAGLDADGVVLYRAALLDAGARILDCRATLMNCRLPGEDDDVTVEDLVYVADRRIEAKVIGHGAAAALGCVTLTGDLGGWVTAAKGFIGDALALL